MNKEKSFLSNNLFEVNRQDCDNDKFDYVESLTLGAVQRNWSTPTKFPCCPQKITNTPLEDYIKNLQKGKIFCKHKYGQSKIINFGLSKDKNSIIVQCFDAKSSIKKWYIAQVTVENNLFVHTTYTSCFTSEGAKKYYTLALGEKWTGGDTFDDYC